MLPALLALNSTAWGLTDIGPPLQNFTTDTVSIAVALNWTYACHNVHRYLYQFCDSVEAQSCEPLAVGSVLCFRGICFCMPHSAYRDRRRHLRETTTITAAITHSHTLHNKTAWPPWVYSVTIIDTPEDPPYWLLALSALLALGGLCLVGCAIRVYQKYRGYRTVEKGIEVATPL